MYIFIYIYIYIHIYVHKFPKTNMESKNEGLVQMIFLFRPHPLVFRGVSHKFLLGDGGDSIYVKSHTVDGRNPNNQGRLVVEIPSFTRFYTSHLVSLPDF